MAVTLGDDALAPFAKFSLYNSPYTAHDRGCAIDLYPGTERAPSPVAGEVLDTRTVDAPPKPYAGPHDHLVLVDTGEYVARVLHVDPSVEAGDSVALGDPLGTLVRSGFFAPWVDNHLHLGFREDDVNPYRASGSLPVVVDTDLRPLSWDGRGTVVEIGDTYALLDSPAHPAPGSYYAGVAASGGGILDGGLPHYDGGGLLDGPDGPVSLFDQRVGTADDCTVTWDDVTVRVDGTPIAGLSLLLARERTGVKLVCPDHTLAVDDTVRVTVDPA